MAFELYYNNPNCGAGCRKEVNEITIRKNGVFGLGSKMCAKYDVANFTHVGLYYNKETDEIGLKLLKKEIDGSAKIYLEKSRSYTVPCRSFLSGHCGLKLDDGGIGKVRLKLRHDDDLDMLIVGPLSKLRTPRPPSCKQI
ncbi:MAG: hypothetical protein ACYS1A_17465 [Planctomycetota bacterium]|jgi:hypothetical protein